MAQNGYFIHKQSVPAVPIEDLQDSEPGTIVNCRQLLPTKINFTVQDVYERAFLGMSIRLIAASFQVPEYVIAQHFRRTIERAKSDKALKLYGLIEEALDVDEPNPLAFEKSKLSLKLLDRVDPTPKDPQVQLTQVFQNSTVSQLPMTEINDLLLGE
jgi:hypothetical protein